MSYLYIKDNTFNIDNIIVIIKNNKLILNYNINNIEIKLRNIIFYIYNGLIVDNIKNLKLILTDKLSEVLSNIDEKVENHIKKHTSYKYVSVVNKNKDFNYVYIENKVLKKKVNNSHINAHINTHIMLKYILINNVFVPHIYTYNIELL